MFIIADKARRGNIEVNLKEVKASHTLGGAGEFGKNGVKQIGIVMSPHMESLMKTVKLRKKGRVRSPGVPNPRPASFVEHDPKLQVETGEVQS